MYKYFSDSEFKYCDPPCDISNMDKDFMLKLDDARRYAGIPFVINSAYRTVQHELRKGRDGTSSHTRGLAVDIKVESSWERFKIVNALLTAGFTRIGIGKDFIHVDWDREKAGDVIWTYYDD